MSLTYRISALCLAFCLLFVACGGPGVSSTAGSNSSAVGSTTPPIAAALPIITPPGGAFSSVQSVTIAAATPGASIYYTIDGSTPTASSSLYHANITVSATTRLMAIAIAIGDTDSPVATATFTITPAPVLTTLPTPMITPAGAILYGTQTISIVDAASGAAIYYTLDGSTPTTASLLYGGGESFAPGFKTT